MVPVKHYKSPRAARRRLRRWSVAFTLFLSLPVALLVVYIQGQLNREATARLRSAVAGLHLSIDNRLQQLLQREEDRSFEEYSFYAVSGPSQQLANVNYSPLSRFQPNDALPGLLGYFQVNPDATFQSPLFPDYAALHHNSLGLPADEYRSRRERYEMLEALVRRTNLTVRAGPARGQIYLGSAAGLEQGRRELLANNLAVPPAAEVVDAEKGKVTVDWDRQQKSRISRRVEVQQVQPSKLGEGLVKDARERAETERLSQRAEGSALELMSEAGEIDPFQVLLLEDRYLIFFRRVWLGSGRYTQGFVLEQEAFWAQLAELHRISPVAAMVELRLTVNGKSIRHFAPVADSYFDSLKGKGKRGKVKQPVSGPVGQPLLLYQGRLAPPFSAVALGGWSGQKLPVGIEASAVNLLLLCTGLLLVGGLYGLYRVGIKQIAVAQQHSDFVAAVSHELKTPLTSIRLYAEMLRDGFAKDEKKRREYYDFIFFESERLSRLIHNVLQLARLDRNEAALSPESLGADELLDLVRSKVSTQVERAGFTLGLCSHLHSEQRLLVDRDAFCQIMINLVDNALKFAQDAERKEIVLGAKEWHGRLLFWVRDYGPGIAPGDHRRVLALFERGRGEEIKSVPGTGIGLTLVKELSEQMGAELELLPQDPGLEVRLLFPALEI